MLIKFAAAHSVFYDHAKVNLNIDIYSGHRSTPVGTRQSFLTVRIGLRGIQHCLVSRTNDANRTFVEEQADVGELLQFF